MTQITGQIYQMHNGKTGAQRVNRFPITVMEAVYGLNSYLQNQFSSLADIYMPIEGITETKPLQEFVYRACPSSIKAKSVSLDRIYGKTLAWNQILSEAKFNSAAPYNSNYTSVSISGGVLTLTTLASAQYGYERGFIINSLPTPVVGHKYLMLMQIKAENNRGYLFSDYGTGDSIQTISPTFVANQWLQYKALYSATSNSESAKSFIFRMENQAPANEVMYAKNLMIHDLTLLYGSAIDGMTDAQILAKFESEFPGYHEAGNKLISNDAESIETVGFNQWDEEYRLGDYVGSDRQFSPSVANPVLCNSNPIPVFPSTEYYIKSDASGAWVYFYDANGAFINTATVNNATFTTPANAMYLNFNLSVASGQVCINLSDPAKNGTYEPYRKSVMQLNLGSFQARDSQGNITTITGGLKSAGSVYDEIVGNKYIKRVGSVDLGNLTWSVYQYGSHNRFQTQLPGAATSLRNRNVILGSSRYSYDLNVADYPENANDKTWLYYGESTTLLLVIDDSYSDPATFKAAMSGVYLDYELAAPIEYELAEPLVPTVKAGTTEARISPNSDGLSAPMVADMTYDAQANNDSASAQYALTAGRLLNSHKLWGQDFDGTQDVEGALTGVTTLTASGAVTAGSFVKTGGTASQFLKANGTVDSTAYLPLTAGATNPLSDDLVLKYNASANFKGLIMITSDGSEQTRIGSIGGEPQFRNSAGIYKKMWHAGNSNLSTIDWAAKDLSAAGTLTVSGLTSIAGGLKLTTTKKIWFDDTHYLELLTENNTPYLHTNLNVVSEGAVVARAAANS